MEYYLAVKGIKYRYTSQDGGTWKTCKGKKPSTKDQMLGSIYMQCPEEANLQRLAID